MMMDVDQAAKAMRDPEMEGGIKDFLEGFNQPTYQGMRLCSRASTAGAGCNYRGRRYLPSAQDRGVKRRKN